MIIFDYAKIKMEAGPDPPRQILKIVDLTLFVMTSYTLPNFKCLLFNIGK